ncbi:hypothetical protein FHR72_002241 [Mycolicibacterium iranicum]|uniref:ANTAR domain-containing protein n=1 Tax=Mycolicibacterium iranicum TaxID=912594 RepID=A0A839Q3B3_MYCIR|nr:GAF and ANTAR domain-containing protein [Mycolicibacterium iranicum]MBB2990768.1 hypothetical protein [Mycolicibacterium iranicum]
MVDLGRETSHDSSDERQLIQDALQQLDELQRNGASDPDDGLRTLVETAVAAVPGAVYAGITLVTESEDVSSVAATHEYVDLLDAVQQEVREGPCLSAAWENHLICIEDLRSDGRWPKYRDAALARTPVRSVLSFELHTEGKSVAALNFLAETPGAFDADSIELGVVYATHTTLAWNSLRREQQFRNALASRDVIGQAKGILMERHDIDAVAAFDLLRRLSQEMNVKLADLAQQLVRKR